jgi:ankyrin repeat protein
VDLLKLKNNERKRTPECIHEQSNLDPPCCYWEKLESASNLDPSLFCALKKQDLTLVKTALSMGENPNQVVDGISPLIYAIEVGMVDAVLLLLENGADCAASISLLDTTDTHLITHLAALSNNLPMVKTHYDPKTQEGWSPLHWASLAGHVEMVTELIQDGTNVDVKTEFGTTPLHMATLGRRIRIASILVEKGASVTSTSTKYGTSFHIAAAQDDVTMMKFFKSINDDSWLGTASVGGKDNLTPLEVATKNGSLNAVRLFFEFGLKVPVNIFETAVANGQVDAVRLFVELGVDVKGATKRRSN